MGVESLDREEWRPDIATLPYSILGGFKASNLTTISILNVVGGAMSVNAKHWQFKESCTR